MFELLFLLLPIAAAYGYYMGRNSYKDKRAKKKTEQTNNYLKGVDFFINNDRDQAVDKFIAYLNEANPTFESSLALGNLFRQRGEVDRAISLHTSLANNEEVEPYENELAQLELACDFMSAGLLDRAEAILQDMVLIPRQRKSAVALLVKLYEQERDFDKAIAIGKEHQDILSQSSLIRICNYHCELAQNALVAGKFKDALESLSTAHALVPSSIRPSLLRAELLLKEQAAQRGVISSAQQASTRREVVALLQQIAAADHATGPFLLELLRKAFAPASSEALPQDPAYKQALTELAHQTGSAAVLVELAHYLAQYESRSDAELLLLNAIKERPNIKLYSAYMGLRSQEQAEPSDSESIMQLKSLIDAQIARHSVYSCKSCGFESSMMFWQCPSCRRWDTMRPKRAIDGD